jgi:5'-nucleotidase
MAREVEVTPRMRGIAVDGRPADCVKLAVSTLWPARFGAGGRTDLLISGMNSGANVGINVIYSGTVAAALEAAFLGVPSIAVSLHLGKREPRYSVAAAHARRAIEAVLAGGLPRAHECLSINIPVTEDEGPMPPLRVCPMNTHGLIDSYERRQSPLGDPYYWATGHGLDFHGTDEGTDVHALFERCITVTPLHYDLTRHDALPAWRRRLEHG